MDDRGWIEENEGENEEWRIMLCENIKNNSNNKDYGKQIYRIQKKTMSRIQS